MIDLDELDAIFSRCEVGSGLDLEDEDTRMGDVDDESYSSSYCGKSLFKYHNLLGFETKTIVELPWLKLTILVFCPETIVDQSFDGYCQEIVVDAMEVDIDEEVKMELTLEPAEMMEIDEDEDVEMAKFEYDEDIEWRWKWDSI